MRLRSALSLLGLAGMLVCALLFIYFPAVPKSALGWLALVFLGLPVWFLLEWLGEVVLGSRFFARKSSAVRVVLAVPVVAALMVLAVVLVGLVQKIILSL
jgi:hypothetical protein